MNAGASLLRHLHSLCALGRAWCGCAAVLCLLALPLSVSAQQLLRIHPQADAPAVATTAASRPNRLDAEKPGSVSAPGLSSDAPGFGRWLLEPQRCLDEQAARPDEALTLAQALRAVICHNLRLRQSGGTVVQARAALQRERAAGQPSLTLRGELQGARGETASVGTSLNLEWLLFDFGASSAAQLQARLALQAALDDQGTEVLDAVVQAVQLFTATQAALWRLEAATLNVRTALDSRRIAQARLGAGAASQLDRLQAETALSQARLEYAGAVNAWLSARGELALSMGLAATQPLVLQGMAESDMEGAEAPLDAAALVQEARDNHPRVAASRARLDQAQARTAGLEAQRWGQLSLGAQVGTARALTGGAGARSSASHSGSLAWSLPLLDRGVLRSQIDEAKGQTQVRAAELQNSERQTALQVWQEVQALQGLRSSLRANRSLLQAAQAGLRVSAERVRLGVGSFGDLVQAQSALASARLQWAQTKASLSRAEWRLAAATGRLGALQAAVLGLAVAPP